jgi:peptidoglycan/LPS O-acetylase OafA/YrhL
MLHPFVFGVFALKLKSPIGITVALLVSFALAAASWHFFEAPILRIKNRLIVEQPRLTTA